uniref:Uncharacterized protein n=1 Tax=Tetradesmus obliquus TaxID=3088 RepID=A0A383WH82_TETOB|eukprot:jgi/Sobl393_1/11446/SZX63017.1
MLDEVCSKGAAAASPLSRLWKPSAQAKLLQRPPADCISDKQQKLILQTYYNAAELQRNLNNVAQLGSENSAEHVERLLQAVLAARAVSTLARLLVWLQQRPELLQQPGEAGQQLHSGAQMTCPTLWKACNHALGAVMQLVLRHSSNAKLLVPTAEQFVDSELPQLLPEYIGQSVRGHAAAALSHCGQLSRQLCSPTLAATVGLSRYTAAILTHDSFASVAGIDWEWAAELLQQLLSCAVAAGLMRALPGGSLAEAAEVLSLKKSSGGSSSSSSNTGGAGSSSNSSSSSSSGELGDRILSCIASDLSAVAIHLIEATDSGRRYKEIHSCVFVNSAAIAEGTLQLLAMRCCQMHQHLQQQQQQQGQRRRQSQQLGRRMRGDLLLLPDPLAGPLLQLLPSKVLLEVRIEADKAEAEAHTHMLLRSADALCSVLRRHVDLLSSSSSSPVLSAAALQLTAELLLRAAADLQRRYMLLPAEQQVLLQAGEAEGDDLWPLLQAEFKLNAPACLLIQSCKLLQQQTAQLWASGQWQQLFQLLQQGGGQVLLQGLTLAVHCCRLDGHLQDSEGLAVRELLTILQPTIDSANDTLTTRRDLFTSQLARKHPVPFFQFLDICARSEGLDEVTAGRMLFLVTHGCAKIGTKGLAELLGDSAATAALGSALCSSMKLWTAPDLRCSIIRN